MAKKELSMRTLLMNSIAYPPMIMSVANHDEAQMRKDPDFIEHMKTFTMNRWRQVFRSCNSGDPKAPRYVG